MFGGANLRQSNEEALPDEVVQALGLASARDESVPIAMAWTGITRKPAAVSMRPHSAMSLRGLRNQPPRPVTTTPFTELTAEPRRPKAATPSAEVNHQQHTSLQRSAAAQSKTKQSILTPLRQDKPSRGATTSSQPHSVPSASPMSPSAATRQGTHSAARGARRTTVTSLNRDAPIQPSPDTQLTLEEMVSDAELEGLRTVDQAVITMRRTASRIQTMASALAGGMQLVKAAPTVIDVGGDASTAYVADPELRRIAELQRRLELAVADSDSQRAQINQLQAELSERDQLVHALQADVAELEARVGELEHDLEEQKDLAAMASRMQVNSTLAQSMRLSMMEASGNMSSANSIAAASPSPAVPKGMGGIRAVVAAKAMASRARQTVAKRHDHDSSALSMSLSTVASPSTAGARRTGASTAASPNANAALDASSAALDEFERFFVRPSTACLPPSLVCHAQRQFVARHVAHSTGRPAVDPQPAPQKLEWHYPGASFANTADGTGAHSLSAQTPYSAVDLPSGLGLPSMRCTVSGMSFSAQPAAENLIAGKESGDPGVAAVYIVFQDVESIDPTAPTRSGMQYAARKAAKIVADEAEKRHGVAIVRGALSTLYVFRSAAFAADFGVEVHQALVKADWPSELEQYSETSTLRDDDDGDVPIFKGVRVALGVHCGGIHWTRAAHSDRLHFYGPGLGAAIALGCLATEGLLLADRSIWKQLDSLAAFLDDPYCTFAEWTFNPFVLAACANLETDEPQLPGDDRLPEELRFLCPVPLAQRIRLHHRAAHDAPEYQGALDPHQPPPPISAVEYCGMHGVTLAGVSVKAARAMMRHRTMSASRRGPWSNSTDAIDATAEGDDSAAPPPPPPVVVTPARADASGRGSPPMDEEYDPFGRSARKVVPGCRPVECPLPVDALLCASSVPHLDAPAGRGVTSVSALTTHRGPFEGFACVVTIGLAGFAAAAALVDEATSNTALTSFRNYIRRCIAQHNVAVAASASSADSPGSNAIDTPLVEACTYLDRFVIVARDVNIAVAFAHDVLRDASKVAFDYAANRTASEFVTALQALPRVDGQSVGNGPMLVASCDFTKVCHAYSLATYTGDSPDSAAPPGASGGASATAQRAWILCSPEQERLRVLHGIAEAHGANTLVLGDAAALKWYVTADGAIKRQAVVAWHIDATIPMQLHGTHNTDDNLYAAHVLVPRSRAVTLLHVARSIAQDDAAKWLEAHPQRHADVAAGIMRRAVKEAIAAEKRRLLTLCGHYNRQGTLGHVNFASGALEALLYRVATSTIAARLHEPTKHFIAAIHFRALKHAEEVASVLHHSLRNVGLLGSASAKLPARILGRPGAVREALERARMTAHDMHAHVIHGGEALHLHDAPLCITLGELRSMLQHQQQLQHSGLTSPADGRGTALVAASSAQSRAATPKPGQEPSTSGVVTRPPSGTATPAMYLPGSVSPPPGALAFLSGSGAENALQSYLESKLTRASQTVQCLHLAMEAYFKLMQRFLDPLWDPSTAAIADDDCIAAIVRVAKASKKRVALETNSSNVPSLIHMPPRLDGEEKPLLSDEWVQLISQALRLGQHTVTGEHDVVDLCASMLGHCGEFFLYLRSMARRLATSAMSPPLLLQPVATPMGTPMNTFSTSPSSLRGAGASQTTSRASFRQ